MKYTYRILYYLMNGIGISFLLILIGVLGFAVGINFVLKVLLYLGVVITFLGIIIGVIILYGWVQDRYYRERNWNKTLKWVDKERKKSLNKTHLQ